MKKTFYLFMLLAATIGFNFSALAKVPIAPSNGAAISLSGDRNQTIIFASDSVYTQVQMDTVGRCNTFARFGINAYTDSLSVTYESIKSTLLNSGGYKVGDVVHCDWTVSTTVGSLPVFSTTIFKITFTIGYFDDEPHMFNLLTPSANGNVNITQGPATQSITFSWNKSFCKNGDSVKYSLLIDTPNLKIDDNTQPYYAGYFKLTDTFFTMSYNDIYNKIINYAHMSKPGSLKISWSVYAENAVTIISIPVIAPDPNVLTINYVYGVGIKNNGFDGDVLCFPNPANTITNFSFNLKEKETVRIALYDMSGKKIHDMIYNNLPAGKNNIACSLDGISQGLYIWKLESETAEATGKINVSE